MAQGESPRLAASPPHPPTRLAPSLSQSSFMQLYPDLPIINLSPGELLISAQTRIVSTILGSCISLCLHSEKLRISAICQGMLPRQSKLPMAGYFPYLDTAVPHVQKTGGTKGYKIFFNTATGEVFVRRIPPNSTKNLALIKEKQATP